MHNSTTLLNHVMAIATQLPILGNPQATEIRYLMHFSTDRNIKEFEARPLNYCWADVLSADVNIVREITNAMPPTAYEAVYVLRVGLPASTDGGFDRLLIDSPVIGEWVCGKPGTCREYGLAVFVRAGEFAKIDLHLDPSKSFYHP
ncbi:hypothetical protein [Pseudomonas bohemica]|uniref:hypothetical protein n=1 Tax=Pseudomonas bohemica TaxID=2044872 RepID=UPI0018FEDCDA|nr:hypothetical protein [Pseudomonas bohemica]